MKGRPAGFVPITGWPQLRCAMTTLAGGRVLAAVVAGEDNHDRRPAALHEGEVNGGKVIAAPYDQGMAGS